MEQHTTCSCAAQRTSCTAPALLQYLRLIAELLQPYGSQAMFYLAAAVSDFYVPWGQLTHHKIQRLAAGWLLEPPCALGLLVHAWASQQVDITYIAAAHMLCATGPGLALRGLPRCLQGTSLAST